MHKVRMYASHKASMNLWYHARVCTIYIHIHTYIQVAEMKKKEAANEKLMFEIAQENKRLSEPLTRALKEVELLRHELSNYDKDKLSLQNTKVRMHMCTDTHTQTHTYITI
jgi:hypothetical protein